MLTLLLLTYLTRIVDATSAVQAGIFKKKTAAAQKTSDSAIDAVFKEIDGRVKSEGAALVKEVKGLFNRCSLLTAQEFSSL